MAQSSAACVGRRQGRAGTKKESAHIIRFPPGHGQREVSVLQPGATSHNIMSCHMHTQRQTATSQAMCMHFFCRTPKALAALRSKLGRRVIGLHPCDRATCIEDLTYRVDSRQPEVWTSGLYRRRPSMHPQLQHLHSFGNRPADTGLCRHH